MPKFLNTSGISYHLEEILRNARERLTIISPFVKFNERIRELLQDADRMKLDIRIVYGKKEMAPGEQEWINSMKFVRCSFCRNLHAKAYLNESEAILTSMNLYEFSQVNNNEMGILATRSEDGVLFQDICNEAQRLIRLSDEGTGSVAPSVGAQTLTGLSDENTSSVAPSSSDSPRTKMVSTTKLAQSMGLKSKELFSRLLNFGYVIRKADAWELTEKGRMAGGATKKDKRFGTYITWPSTLASTLGSTIQT